MKLIFSDSLDYVDPNYDFHQEKNASGREPYWDDVYPHELLGYAPYDGVLVSRATVGDVNLPGKYTESQAMRFRRVGAKRFLRLDSPEYGQLDLFGDCGAFSYAKEKHPPFQTEDTLEFYEDGGFTHGCSVDHVIFDFDEKAKGLDGGSEEAKDRFEITLNNAEDFLKKSAFLGKGFKPLGVVQGWSADSMAEAARRLVAMGYDYIAVGGLVPLKTPQIHQVLQAIQAAVGHASNVKIHLLGFAKAGKLPEFSDYQVASIDTTSPLVQAFKDNKANFYFPRQDGGLRYFTAIRIPQVLENNQIKRLIQEGRYKQETLIDKEQKALAALRGFDKGKVEIDTCIEEVMAYKRPVLEKREKTEAALNKKIDDLERDYRETLSAQPWRKCGCPVCKNIGIEVILFRGSNRNKRRGIHNLAAYYTYLRNHRLVA